YNLVPTGALDRHEVDQAYLTRILEQPSLPGIASCGSVNPFAPKPAGALRSKGRGDFAVHERAMVQAVRAALRPCLTPRDRDAADPAGQGRYGSTTVPPAPRCSRVQRTGPCKRWLDSARTVARNGMWVRRSVAIGNQAGLAARVGNAGERRVGGGRTHYGGGRGAPRAGGNDGQTASGEGMCSIGGRFLIEPHDDQCFRWSV